jgi:parallel beta-helix repeat protein
VTGAICDHPSGGTDFLTQVQGTGILALGVAPGTVISQNVVTNNDIGIAVGSTVDCCRLTQNRLRDNRCYGMAVVDGRQTISNTTVTGGLVGVSVSFEAPTTATLDQVVIAGAATPVQEPVLLRPAVDGPRLVLHPLTAGGWPVPSTERTSWVLPATSGGAPCERRSPRWRSSCTPWAAERTDPH